MSVDNLKAFRDVRLPLWRAAWNWWPWVRRMHDVNGHHDGRRWFWTPATYRFGHGGWIYLSLPWLWRFRSGSR